MICFAGDIHGTLEIDRIVNYFRISRHKFSKNDFLVLLGDVGVCWDGDKRDAEVRGKLSKLPVTVLWIDGNHENFDLIDQLPVTDWNGGKVQIVDGIVHLMRGYVYNLGDKKVFAFGGGLSIDKHLRTEGLSWWSQEMPTEEEYERGLENLAKVNYEVDYVVTHTAPSSIAYQLVSKVLPGEEALQDYLQKIAMIIKFKHWYFGHWHMDCRMHKFTGLYNLVEYVHN